MNFPRSVLCGAILIATSTGCSSGPKLVIPKGQLTYKKNPLKIDPKTSLTVVFVQAVEKGEKANSYPADPLNREDASFVVPGREHTGIPLGKYRVVISLIGTPPPQVPNINDRFSKENTQIVREVKDDLPIVVDLSKPEG